MLCCSFMPGPRSCWIRETMTPPTRRKNSIFPAILLAGSKKPATGTGIVSRSRKERSTASKSWAIDLVHDLICTTTLRPAKGKGQPQEFDDNPDVLHPLQFFSRSEDPQRQGFVAAVDGDYLLQVSSREADQEGSPRHIYRLRITPEQPDFRLIAMPSNPRDLTAEVLGASGSTFLTMLVWRQDGFNDAITLSADGLPEGVTCVPQVIGPGQRQAALVLTADENAKPWTGFVTIRGTATINGKPVVREARSASITWPTPAQQNVPAVSRLDHGLALAVRGKDFLRVHPATDHREGIAW